MKTPKQLFADALVLAHTLKDISTPQHHEDAIEKALALAQDIGNFATVESLPPQRPASDGRKAESLDDVTAPGDFFVDRTNPDAPKVLLFVPGDDSPRFLSVHEGETGYGWKLTGTDDAPTLTPSINAFASDGTTSIYHGYLQAGKFTPDLNKPAPEPVKVISTLKPAMQTATVPQPFHPRSAFEAAGTR